jgi:hypothetical protein
MPSYRRHRFLEVFKELPDGALSLLIPIEVNGVTFGPGVVFQRGVVYGGIDFHLYKYKDIAFLHTENDEGPKRFAGFYQD